MAEFVIEKLLELTSEIKGRIDEAETNKKRKEALGKHVETLEIVLKALFKRVHGQNGKNSPLERALEDVNEQLKVASEMVMELNKKGWKASIRMRWRSKDIAADFETLNARLDAAIRNLQLAQSVQFGDNQQTIISLLERQLEMHVHVHLDGATDIISGAVALAISTFQRDQDVLKKQGQQGHSLDNIHLFLKQGEVAAENKENLKDEGDCDDPSQAPLRYNCRILTFLKEQMAIFESVSLNKFIPQLMEGTEKESEDWRESCKTLLHAQELGRMLIRRHARRLNLRKFYTVAEAQHAVQTICGALALFVECWKLQASGTRIQERVPQPCLDSDRSDMDALLRFILNGEQCDFGAVSPGVAAEEWQQLRQEHSDRLRNFRVVEEDAISMDEHELVAGKVYKATWRHLQVAVKKYVKVDGTGKPDYEEFARFYAEAAAMASMHSPWVVQLHAVTRQGKLVMELGRVDMVTWFGQHREGGLALKLSLLRDAAHGLEDVHEKNFVHRDVRNKTFVVFCESPVTVKLVGLGSAMVCNATGKVTARKVGRAIWAAPEIFKERPHSVHSDIYSFGIVMYEVVAEAQPYGGGTPDGTVMEMKEGDKAPCRLPAGVPVELAGIMAQCCSADPEKRPRSMRDVCKVLTSLSNEYPYKGGSGS